LLAAMLAGAAGTFQGLDEANARQTGAAVATLGPASARTVSAMSATGHAAVRAERTRVSVEGRNIRSGAAAPQGQERERPVGTDTGLDRRFQPGFPQFAGSCCKFFCRLIRQPVDDRQL
jgi:hypothetical protein